MDTIWNLVNAFGREHGFALVDLKMTYGAHGKASLIEAAKFLLPEGYVVAKVVDDQPPARP